MNMARSAPLMRLALLLIASLGIAGCKSQCRQLSERLCECELNSNERSNCVSRAANAEGVNPGNFAQEEYCRARLQPGPEGCDCRLIATKEGKMRCGLARDPSFDAGI
jgi:hypothetical protein